MLYTSTSIDMLFAIPIIGALFIAFIPSCKNEYNNLRLLTLCVTCINIIPLVFLLLNCYKNIRSSGILFGGYGFHWHIDSMAMCFVSLTIIIMPLCVIASESIKKNVRLMLIMLLITTPLCLGVFLAKKLIVFYIFFEMSLLPMFFMIGIWGSKDKVAACFRFILYTISGSLPLLIVIIYLSYLNQSSPSGDIEYIVLLMQTGQFYQITTINVPNTILWWIMFFAFGIKVPIVPLHTWLPSAHAEAPTACSMLLAGIMIKMGGYAMMRIMVPMFPDMAIRYQDITLWMGVFAIIYGSFITIKQTDIKKMIACSSVAHMGYVTVGIFSLTPSGQIGALFQMLSHGLISSGLFFLIGAIYARTKTRNISDYGGLASKMPVYSVFFLILSLANIALPGTSGFVGEWLTINSLMKYATANDFAIIVIMSCGAIFSASYMLLLCKKMLFGTIKTYQTGVILHDLNYKEISICLVLISLIIILGVYPNIITNSPMTIDIFKPIARYFAIKDLL